MGFSPLDSPPAPSRTNRRRGSDAFAAKDLTGKVTPADVALSLRLAGRPEVVKTVRVPDEQSVHVVFGQAGELLTAEQARHLSIVKRPLGSIFVMDLKVGAAVGHDTLGRAIAGLLAADLQQYTSGQVSTMADVNDLLKQQSVKDRLADCSETQCMTDVASAMGTDYILGGDIEKVGSYLVANLRLIKTTSAAAVARSSFRSQQAGDPADTLVPGIPAALEDLMASLPR